MVNLKNAFSVKPLPKTKLGNAGYDNARENIDPHIRTKVVSSREIVTGDHGLAAKDMVINVCYGTGDPPAASTTTEGTLFLKYAA